MGRVAPDHAAKGDDAGETARLGQRHRREGKLEGARDRHHGDRVRGDAADSELGDARSRAGDVVTSPLNRPTTTPTARRSPRGAPSSTETFGGTFNSPGCMLGAFRLADLVGLRDRGPQAPRARPAARSRGTSSSGAGPNAFSVEGISSAGSGHSSRTFSLACSSSWSAAMPAGVSSPPCRRRARRRPRRPSVARRTGRSCRAPRSNPVLDAAHRSRDAGQTHPGLQCLRPSRARPEARPRREESLDILGEHVDFEVHCRCPARESRASSPRAYAARGPPRMSSSPSSAMVSDTPSTVTEPFSTQ